MIGPVQLLSLPGRAHLVADLLDWFRGHSRDLPWRGGDDLYGIWVSEIMLQQTTVQTVIPYWRRFMAEFPSVAALAAADPSAVLSLWSGLGYYSRARSLHRAARQVCQENRGVLPDSFEGWLALPGVGPYTAGAIASLGLGQRVPALDANARRVLSRWAVTDPDAWAALSESERRRRVDRLGAQLVPADNPGRWNEALMELGALLCGARRTACDECPVSGSCQAAQGGWVQSVPARARRQAPVSVWAQLVVLAWRDRVLLRPATTAPLPGPRLRHAPLRKDFIGLHKGLWGLPTSAWFGGATAPAIPWPAWRESLGLPARLWPIGRQGDYLGEFRHAITRYRLTVPVFRVNLEPTEPLPTPLLADSAASADPETGGLFFGRTDGYPPLSALAEKALHFHHDTAV